LSAILTSFTPQLVDPDLYSWCGHGSRKMALLFNIIWFVLGGWAVLIAWIAAGLICLVSIVFIPWAPAVFRIGVFAAAPFGKEMVDKRMLNGGAWPAEQSTRDVLNIIWLVFVGWWLALASVIHAIALCCTIIGIPFGLQALKIAGAALWPVGSDIVPKDLLRAHRFGRF
jgi:uncharacterized membrane protein YccF (DUF307 family)